MNITILLSAGLGLGLWCTGVPLAAAPTASPADLLRQGVLAEETGKSTAEAVALYQKAVEAGEPLRIATATALYRLGELEWRNGKTNEAIRTWQLLEAQYADQTNLIYLARERVPLGLSLAQVVSPSGTANPEMTATARAAAVVAQLDRLPVDQWPRWLDLQGFSSQRLKELLTLDSQLRYALKDDGENSKQDPFQAAQQAASRPHQLERRRQLIAQETEETESIVTLLRLMATNSLPSAALNRTKGTSPPASGIDISPEEQAELARVQRLWRDSPDLLISHNIGRSAAEKGHTQVLEFLVAKRISFKGTQFLSRAALSGQLAAVELLIRAGADPNDPAGFATPLVCAAARGHQRVVAALIKSGAKVDLLSPWNSDLFSYLDRGLLRPVHAAVFQGRQSTLELLVESGADVNAGDGKGRSPLHLAARSDDKESVNYLLSKKAEVNTTDVSGNTPLTLTSNPHLQRVLLEAGADPNKFPSDDQAALWQAVQSRNPELMTLLIDKGARVDLKVRNNTLLDLALTALTSGVDATSEDYLRTRRFMCEVLLKAGVRMQSKGKRLIHWGVESNDPELVALALRFGEKPDDPDDFYTPLVLATLRDVRMVELLLAAGANPNKRSKNPNHSAFEYARAAALNTNPNSRKLSDADIARVVELLVEKGGRLFFSTTISIAFASDLTNSLKAVFQRTPVSVEREFTLAEMLDHMLLRSLEPGQQDRTLMPWYPDLAGAYLYNDLDRTQPPRRKALDLAALIESGDFGKSLRFDWGDILVVPRKTRQGDEEPYVLPAAKAEALNAAIRKTIAVNIGGVTESMVFERAFVVEPEKFRSKQSGTYPTVNALTRAAATLGEKKFHNRFRVVRRGEPGPLDEVFLFDSSFGSPRPGTLPMIQSPVAVGVPGVPGRPLSPPQFAPAGLPGSAPSIATDEFRNGDAFVLQDGDSVTLYPLPKP